MGITILGKRSACLNIQLNVPLMLFLISQVEINLYKIFIRLAFA